MKTLSRAILPAMAILASVATAQAQTQTQDHQAHHPAGQSEQAQPAQTPMPAPGQGMGMMGGSTGTMGGGMGMMGGASGMPMGCPMMGKNRDTAAGAMHGMQMMGQGGMGMPFDYIDGRIAFLKAEIGITDDQAKAWDAFAGALRQRADAHQAMHKQMVGANASEPSSWPKRLEQHAKAMSSHAAALTAVSEAAGPLYEVLTEEQRQKADRLLSGPMGMPMVAK